MSVTIYTTPQQRTMFWVSIFSILAIRLFYIVSFPLNFGGDGSIYYTMILNKQSNLFMAGGYPFLMMIPYHWLRGIFGHIWKIPEDPSFTPWWQTSALRHDLIGSRPLEDDFSWVAFFQNHDFIIFQHSIALLALFCAFLLCRKYFGFSIALIFLVINGICPMSLEWPSSVFPEWLQGAILVFWIFFADRVRSAASSKKLYYYALLGVLSAFGFLVKFNSLPLHLLFFAGLLFCDREWIGKTIAKLSVSLVAAFCSIALFIACYHFPTTGTSILSMNSWVLAVKYFQFIPENSLPMDLGICSKRLLALYRDLPKDDDRYIKDNFFYHIDARKQEREPYRNQSLWMMQASDQQLDQNLHAHGFEPIREHDPTLRIAYYIGLPEYSALHRAIYVDAIKKYPLSFFLDTTQGFFRSFAMRDKSYEFRPSWSEIQTGRHENSHCGFVKFLWPNDRFVCYHENAAWLPGVWFFTKLHNLWPPTCFLWMLAFFAFARALKNIEAGYRRPATYIVLFLFLSLSIYVCFSNCASAEFRLKDFEFVRLIVTTLSAIGIYQITTLMRRFLRSTFFNWRKKRYASDLS